jgi:hypothetical protein
MNSILDNLGEILEEQGKRNTFYYRNYKLILTSDKKGLSKVSEDFQESFDPPSKNIKVYSVYYGLDKKWKPSTFSFGPFYISCYQLTLTPELKLVQLKEDLEHGRLITYTNEELETIGFKKSHINLIIKAIKNKTVNMTPGKKVTITDVLKSTKQLSRLKKKKK